MGQWPVRLLCETLEVSPAGYYAWRQRPRSTREQRRDALLVEVRAIHAARSRAFATAARASHAELAARGHDCYVNTVANLMRQARYCRENHTRKPCCAHHGL